PRRRLRSGCWASLRVSTWIGSPSDDVDRRRCAHPAVVSRKPNISPPLDFSLRNADDYDTFKGMGETSPPIAMGGGFVPHPLQWVGASSPTHCNGWAWGSTRG